MSNVWGVNVCSRQRLLLLASLLLLGLTFSAPVYAQDTSPGLVLSKKSVKLVATESENLHLRTTYTSKRIYVRLKTKPTGRVLVTSTSNHPDLRVRGGSQVFEPSNWDTPQSIRLQWTFSPDLLDETAIVSLIASGAGYDGVSESITAKLINNSLLDIQRDYVELLEGESESFRVRLSARPSENLTVTVQPGEKFNKTNATFDTDADALGDQNTLTFTPANWNAWQTVTVSLAACHTTQSELYVILPNGGYRTVSVYMYGKTTCGIFSFSPINLTLDEGTSGVVTARLPRPPDSPITLRLNRHGSLYLDKTSLTFTQSNWSIPQTVTISAEEDRDQSDGSGYVRFDLPTGNKRAKYDNYGHVSVYVRDNDLGINVNSTVGSLDVSEGNSEKFPVRLNTAPSGTVTVNVLPPPDSDLTVDTNPYKAGNQDSLTFTTENWSTPQTVIVKTAEDDDGIDDDIDVSLIASGNDTGYAGQTASLRVNVYDDDRYPIIEMASDPLVMTEGGSARFRVRMVAQISEDFEITIRQPNNTDVTADINPDEPGNQNKLRFNSDNWNIPQAVTVSAAEDADHSFEATFVKVRYGHWAEVRHDVGILVADNDTAGLVLSTTSLNIPEGGSNNFSVGLTTRPSGDVTVQLAQESPDNADVTLDESSLTFTSENWNTPQTVRVSAGQ
ncbi:MAG: hypothetical protein ISN29_10810, partial [Gammaproteobacteria bacterium AqS3]|nr:hypothetical protein [Gammaproteobacteria bacterium AqS3]